MSPDAVFAAPIPSEDLFRCGADEMLGAFRRCRAWRYREAEFNELDRLVTDWREGRATAGSLDELVARAASPDSRADAVKNDEGCSCSPDMRPHRRGAHHMLAHLLRLALSPAELDLLAAEIARWRRYELDGFALSDVMGDAVRRIRATSRR